MTDVSVTLNKRQGVPVTFNSETLSSTARRLFEEIAPAQAYALAKSMVDALYALITSGNYSNATTAALNAFARSSVIDVGTALNKRGVPMGSANRTLLLSSDYFGALAKDSAIVTLSAYQRPEIITAGMLPDVHGFGVVDAPNLPTTGNLTGFGFTPDALALAVRVPNDYTSALPGASNGSVSTVTNPDAGMSVQMVQYVDHNLGQAKWRLAFMFGVAKGQVASGQRLVSA